MRALPLVGALAVQLAPTASFAAELTEMPPALRSDIEVGYGGSFGFAGLEEADQIFGRQRSSRHDLLLSAEFAPIAGIALRVALPITPSYTVMWQDVVTMGYDPVTGSGSYVGGDPIDEPGEIAASGMQGVWVGAALAPFSETYELSQQVTWRIEAAFRPPVASTYWTVADGKRGVAGGAGAWKLGAAFSTDRGIASPYLGVEAILEGKGVVVDVADADGNTVVEGLEVDPASTVDIVGGIELVSTDDEETGMKFAIDLHVGFGYVSWADVPSGLYLPSVLDASKTIAVTQGEHLRFRTGLGFIYDINDYFGVTLGVEGRYHTPYRLEHVYPVTTSIDSFEIAATVELEGRIR